MQNEIQNTLNINRGAETAAFAILSLTALLAIGKAFSEGDPAVIRPIEKNRMVRSTRRPSSRRNRLHNPGGFLPAGLHRNELDKSDRSGF